MPMLMPQAGDVHVNAPLTNMLIGWENQEFIADQIFPIVQVNKQSDIIPQVNQSAYFRNDAAKPIGEGGEAQQIGYTVDNTNTYFCLHYGKAHFISDERRANEDEPYDSDEDGMRLLFNSMRLTRELSFISDFWATSKWTTDKTGGTDFTKWSDYGSSTPIADLRSYKRTIRQMLGRDANTLVLGDDTADVLLDHPALIDRIKYTERGMATPELLAALLGLDKVLIGRSIQASSAEGTAEASVSYSASWGDDALLLYVPQSPSLYVPSAGYTFVWKVGMGNGIEWMRKYREDKKLGDTLEIHSYFDQKQTVANAGLFMTDAVD